MSAATRHGGQHGTSWGDLKYSVGWWSGGGPAQWAHGTMQHPPEDRTDVGDEGDERTVAGAEDCPPGDHKVWAGTVASLYVLTRGSDSAMVLGG